MDKIKPPFKLKGSKYRFIEEIINHLNIQNDSKFFDIFTGRGIVATNVRYIMGCQVFLNDYDKVLSPLNIGEALLSQCRYGGNKTGYTKASFAKTSKLLANDNFYNRIQEYKRILNECVIFQDNYLDLPILALMDCNKFYLDPPYFNVKGIYKNEIRLEPFIKFAKSLINYGDVLISTNDAPEIREAFKDWRIIERPITYSSIGTGTFKKVNELLILWRKDENL